MRELEPVRKEPGLVLQPAGPVPVSTPAAFIPTPSGAIKRDYSGVLEYWHMVRRHQRAVVAIAVLGGLVGFGLTLSQPRIYQARTTVEIQSLNDNFLNMKELNPTVQDSRGFYNDSDIQTQVKIIQSKSLARRVSDKLAANPLPPDAIPI